jgi:hypothetical protein
MTYLFFNFNNIRNTIYIEKFLKVLIILINWKNLLYTCYKTLY